jgi:putative two-component system response regulator
VIALDEVPRTGTDARILVVDDEDPIRISLTRLLSGKGYHCEAAPSAAEARRLLASSKYELMLCDVLMPGENGFSLLSHVRSTYPDVAVIMVTAVDSPTAAAPAAQYGAYGYIIKPFDTSTILINVVGALRRRADSLSLSARQAELENESTRRGAELADALANLDLEGKALSDSQRETVLRLALAAEWRDPVTGDHLSRMSEYSGRLATLAGMAADRIEDFCLASQMHDIGKIGLPDEILLKKGAYTSEDRLVMQRHPDIGFTLLSGSDSPLLKLGAIVALTHHERFDGSGYPKGLVGKDIPLEGRIVALADVYDALRSERPYKPKFTKEASLEIVKDGRGSHFDPELTDLFIHFLEETADA